MWDTDTMTGFFCGGFFALGVTMIIPHLMGLGSYLEWFRRTASPEEAILGLIFCLVSYGIYLKSFLAEINEVMEEEVW